MTDTASEKILFLNSINSFRSMAYIIYTYIMLFVQIIYLCFKYKYWILLKELHFNLLKNVELKKYHYKK